MSQDFMDPELFADFIVEAKEHLETIEPNLLELEKNPGNLGLLNEIFRPMHSLKGASGFLGLNHINGLAHKAENILDELRKGNLAVTAEIMDVILAATDNLRTMIDNLEQTGAEGDVDTAPVIARIAAILSGGAPAPAAPPAGRADEEAKPVSDTPVEATEDVAQTDVPPPGPAQEPVQTAPENEPVTPVVIGEPYALTSIGEGHLADFMEEAREIVERLNGSLLELETDAGQNSELVNDIFRYFHNLKGNSGIIGHKELNALTHEAETLLNRVRKGEIGTSRGMIDLLLSCVDFIEALIGGIDQAKSTAVPLDISPLTARLQKAAEQGEAFGRVEPETPAAPSGERPEPAPEPAAQAPEQEQQQEESAPATAYDAEDVAIFERTISQQLENMHIALDGLGKDASSKDLVDGLYRTLVTIQNSSAYMGFEDVKTYAERTAGLVDQGRKSDMPFDLLLDILRQECAILGDMVWFLHHRGAFRGGRGARAAKTGPARDHGRPRRHGAFPRDQGRTRAQAGSPQGSRAGTRARAQAGTQPRPGPAQGPAGGRSHAPGAAQGPAGPGRAQARSQGPGQSGPAVPRSQRPGRSPGRRRETQGLGHDPGGPREARPSDESHRGTDHQPQPLRHAGPVPGGGQGRGGAHRPAAHRKHLRHGPHLRRPPGHHHEGAHGARVHGVFQVPPVGAGLKPQVRQGGESHHRGRGNGT
jgi:two-component system chemotaxis sensor kinase CheA